MGYYRQIVPPLPIDDICTTCKSLIFHLVFTFSTIFFLEFQSGKKIMDFSGNLCENKDFCLKNLKIPGLYFIKNVWKSNILYARGEGGVKNFSGIAQLDFTFPKKVCTSRPVARIESEEVRNPPKVDLLDQKIDFLNLTPLNPPSKTPFLAHFVGKSGTFARFGGA